jgi:hypothetical protein
MSNELTHCDAPDCRAVATRGCFCPSHAVPCGGCQEFYADADLTDGVCARCRRLECDEALETYVGATCWCAQHGRAA